MLSEYFPLKEGEIMKYCPQCQTRYTDDTLRFCLQDGTPLNPEPDAANVSPTVQLNETETLVTPRSVEPLRFDLPEHETRQEQMPPIPEWQNVPPPKKSKAVPLILLTVFLTVLLLGAGIAAALFYMKSNRGETAKNTAANVGNKSSESNAKTDTSVKTSSSPIDLPKNANAANVSNNVNAAVPVDLKPVPPVDREQIKEEVTERVDGWRSLTESRNLDDYMNYYAGTVDYYNKRGASASAVRSDKQRAFRDFDSIEMNISNLTVTPDSSGERATAVFDKEWVFDGAEKSSSGKVKSELQLRKIKGEWLIVSERDLKVYYIE
jgi:flagellar basal body-associated protein FliL